MQIILKEVRVGQIAELNGSLDAKSAPEVLEKLSPLTRTGKHLIINLTGVDALTSAGLRVLLALKRQMQAPARLVLTGLSDEIEDSMATSGFKSDFDIIREPPPED